MGGGQFGPSPLLGMKDPWSGSKTDFLPDPFQQDPGRDEHRHQIAVSMVSEGGLELPRPAPVRVLVGNYCHVMGSSDGPVHEEQSCPPNP